MLLQTGSKQARNYGLFEIGWVVGAEILWGNNNIKIHIDEIYI
jgi:hypothetical protein